MSTSYLKAGGNYKPFLLRNERVGRAEELAGIFAFIPKLKKFMWKSRHRCVSVVKFAAFVFRII